MDWNAFLHKGILRGGLCILLSAAIVLGLVLPGTGMKRAEPENPLEDEGIREITVLKVGDNISELNTIVVPNGGSAAPTEPNETNPEETNPDETKPNETIPEETEAEKPDIDDGEEGNEDNNQGEEGGEELNLDLAMVMTWYKYGNEPKTLVCGPDKAVSKTLNTAQLIDNELKYEFNLKGADAEYVEITSVSVAEGDGAYRTVSDDGSIQINLPGGTGDRRYTFKVEAHAEKQNEEGDWVEQDITFIYVIKCEYTMDLQMELSWTPKDASERIITCGPDKAEVFSVQSYEVTERIFQYTTKLTGSLAEDAEITEASYTTASGQESGPLEMDNGTLVLYPAPGDNEETYYLTFTVQTPDCAVLYTYNLVYQEQLDVQLSFTWMDRGMISHEMTCQPDGSVSERIKNNQLSAGAIPYEMELTGADAADGRIVNISYASEAAGGANLDEQGSLPMSMPDGSTSNTYRITVNALAKGQRMTFEIVLYYANDVTVQMEYSVNENGANTQRFVTCENTKSRTAEDIYDDQLNDGILEYKMSIAGSDSDSVSITSVTCYQSGSGRSVTLGDSGEIELLLKDGKTGENTFTIKAADDAGNTYDFTINIPYKHRGENNIKIETNLEDGQEIINETKTNLTVKAWSEDASGNVVSYIPANGTDTKLIVKLDDVQIAYTSTSGAASEYDLVPANPEVGDTNTHTLYIYAEDAYGNYGELTLTLNGQRREAGQKVGTATIYVDMTVLGIGVVGPVKYSVLADEPISYVIAKAVLGEDTGDPFGAADDTFGWSGSYAGTLDDGFYLQSVSTGYNADALEGGSWPGTTEEEILNAIDNRFGKGSGLATIWRCLYRNGLNKSSGSGNSFGEFDYTSGSGWMYSVGGSTYYPGQSMSAIYLQDGDVLTLRYTLAYGWDVGGGSPGYGSTVGYCAAAVNGSISISHQMEQIANEDGSLSYVCHCCGLVQDCAHENLTYLDLEDGTHIQYCDDCKSTVGDPEDHVWVYTGEAAEENHTCSACGITEEHRWREVEGTNTATCTESGVRSVQCTTCNMVKEEEAAAKGHTYDNKWQYTEKEHYQICSTCGEEHSHGPHEYVYDSEWEDNLCTVCNVLHDWDVMCSGSQTVKEATCQKIIYHCSGCDSDLTKEGEFEEYHSYVNGICEYCGEEDPDYEPDETEPEVTDPTDPSGHEHSYEVTDSADATCTEAGYKTYTCECGDTYTEEIAAQHSWGEWYTTEEATEDSEGEEARDCSICGETETRITDKLGHSHEYEVIEEKPSTCTEAGYKVYKCECGEFYTENLPLASHNYEILDEEASTCEEAGYREYECSECGDSYDETLPSSGHTWSEWEVTKEPDVGVAGERYRYCEYCYAEETQTIDPLSEESNISLLSHFFRREIFQAALSNILSV